jgi:uncharacterized protein (TIGR03437 family)
MIRISTLLIAVAVCAPLGGQTCNVVDYTTLKNAVQAANAGTGCGTILLADGTYTITTPIGNGAAAIDLMNPVTLKSVNGAAKVTIDANGTYVGIRLAASDITVDGLTIINAQWGIDAYDWTKVPAQGTPLSGIVLRNLVVSTIGTGGHGIALGEVYGDVNDSVIELCTVASSYNHGIILTHAHRNLVINNTVTETTLRDGIELFLSDNNTVAGNSIGSATSSIGFDGIDLHGSQYNYIGNNTIINAHNGVTLTRETGSNRWSIRNWVGNNHILLHNTPGSDGLWFNDNSNFNMSFANDATGASENGFALFSSTGNYLQGNVFFANPQGGIFVNGTPSSDGGCAPYCGAADRNSIEQNYLYNHLANGGVTTDRSTNDDVGFNFIAGSQGQPVSAGLLLQASSGARLYSNVIQNLAEGEYFDPNTSATSLYLNRHFNVPAHYSFSPAAVQWDSGSPVLGGNFYSDFSAANGNPSNGSTPYTNIYQNAAGAKGMYQDRYPYQSENLGKSYGVVALLPAAGTMLAAGTLKTIAWVSQECMLVDLTLFNSSNVATTIVANYPDYGFYRWTVPAMTPGVYTIGVTCKNSLATATSASATTPSFNITPPDLVLLSPQRDLMVNSSATIQFAWKKSGNVGSQVDVYIRYRDSDEYTLLEGAVTNDFVTLTPSPTASNRVNVKIVSGPFADSTDGWFSIRPGTSGQFTAPATAGGIFYVGTPYLLEWISPSGTDYVDIDLVGSTTQNIVTKLADFGRYLMLIPDAQGANTVLRLTFLNSSGTILGTATSVASTVVAGGGFSEGGGTCTVTAFPTSTAVPGTAGTLTLTLNGGSCGWVATSSVSWLTPSTTSGTSSSLNVNVAANATGAQRSGAITVNGQTVTVTQAANNPGQAPGLVSLNPFQGSGPNATLTLVYSHSNGWAAIQSAEFIINPRWESTERSGGCYVKYAPATGLFTLIADDGISVAGAVAPRSATEISNSQCTLDTASSSATGSGTTLTVVVALTFSTSFTGPRHIWMQASDYNNLSTNWLVYGVWFPTQTSVTTGPWYRVYDPFSNSYLYTADTNEYNTLGARGFVQQGQSGLVMSGPTTVTGVSNIAWYRVYVNSTNSHFWTSDRNEFLTLINLQQAYVGEGVAAFVMPYINALGQVSPQVTNSIPFWRAVYQGAILHFWTSDPDEYNGTNGKHLPAGYVGEGIACYIFPNSGAVGIGTSAQFNDGTAALPEEDGGPAVVSAVNGASYVSNGVIAPGQTLTLYGRHLGGQVLMNGVAAQVIAAQNKEIRLVVPKELAGATEVSVEVEYQGHRSKPIKLDLAVANPAIFVTNQWGRGNAQAQNEDGTINGAEHGAARGTVVALYTTGMSLTLPIEVHIGGQPAEVISVQVSGTRAGVTEVRVRIPETVEPGPFQPVVLHLGNLFSQPGVGLAIR